MNWIFNAQTVPGQELAQSVLQADTVHAMQLVVFLVVLGWVIATWLNGRAVAQMSQTQASMGRSNERFFESDGKRTAVMQSQVEETRHMREAFDRSTLLHQQSMDTIADAVRLQGERAASDVQTILNHSSSLATAQSQQIKSDVTDLLGETTLAINAATLAALDSAGRPALEAIGELKTLTEGLQRLQQEQMNLLKRQQDAQMDALKELFDEQMNLLNTQIDRTEKRIVLAISSGRQSHEETKPVDSSSAVGGDVSAGDSSGSAGGNSSGRSGAADGGNGGTTA